MPDNDAEFASGPCLLQATVRMLTFGGFCNKPLRLLGTWEGIKVIHYMHGEIATQITDRQAISLTKKSTGGWRWGHVVKIIECTELVCFRNSVQHSESLSLSAGLFCYSRPLHSHVCVRTLFEFGSGGASYCLQIIRAAPVFLEGLRYESYPCAVVETSIWSCRPSTLARSGKLLLMSSGGFVMMPA